MGIAEAAQEKAQRDQFYEDARAGLNKLRGEKAMSVLGTGHDYTKYDERKNRKQEEQLYEKLRTGLDKLRGLRDRLKIKSIGIGNPKANIKISINLKDIRRALNRLRESKDKLFQD